VVRAWTATKKPEVTNGFLGIADHGRGHTGSTGACPPCRPLSVPFLAKSLRSQSRRAPLSRAPLEGKGQYIGTEAVPNPKGHRLVGSSHSGARVEPYPTRRARGWALVTEWLTNRRSDAPLACQASGWLTSRQPRLEPHTLCDLRHSVARSEACGSIGKWSSETEQI
jgi:hypothetical protein